MVEIEILGFKQLILIILNGFYFPLGAQGHIELVLRTFHSAKGS